MNIQHGHMRYSTTFVEDLKKGCSGFHLHCESFDGSSVVGQTIFWDATGGFVFGTFDGKDVPVEIVAAAIAEAKEKIKIK